MTSSKQIKEQRSRQAVAVRMSGGSFQDVADALGVGKERARGYVASGLSQDRARVLATLESWLNWEGEVTAATLVGIGDYAMELRLIEEEMGAEPTVVSTLMRGNSRSL